jgi:predicted dehydrogenase
MQNKTRICVIGNGEFANKVHYPLLSSFDDVEIVGICAMNEKRLIKTAQKYNIPETNVFVSKSRTGYQEMLISLQPDGVYAIGQPDTMFDIWVWCLKNKFNLYIEKPMGLTIHQSRTLAYLADQNRCITQVSHQRRSAPIMLKMREECLKKGPIIQGVIEFSKFEIQQMLSARDRMSDDFTHCVDTARWLCGGELVKVESNCKRINVPDINWIGATLHFDNGSTCYVIGNWASGRRVFRVQMHAPGICADVELEKEAFLYEEGNYKGKRYGTEDLADSDELTIFGGFLNKHREFIDSILSGEEITSSPFRDTLKTMEICQIILGQELIHGSST